MEPSSLEYSFFDIASPLLTFFDLLSSKLQISSLLWHLSSPLQFRCRFFCVTLIINSYCFIDILPQNMFALWSHLWLLPHAIPQSGCHVLAHMLFGMVALFCLSSANITFVFLAKYSLFIVTKCLLKILSHSESFLLLESVIFWESGGCCGEAMVNVNFLQCQDPPNNQPGYIFTEQHITHFPLTFTLSLVSCNHQWQIQCPLLLCLAQSRLYDVPNS